MDGTTIVIGPLEGATAIMKTPRTPPTPAQCVRPSIGGRIPRAEVPDRAGSGRGPIRILALLALAGALGADASRPDWPNEESRSNSDPWIASHHNVIARMRPRLLVLNFANGVAPGRAGAQVEQLIGVIREGSRYHGYADRAASPFLEYEVFKIIDLTDARARATPLANSTAYPRIEGWNGGDFGNFDYGALFGERFARRFGVPDPAEPDRFLDLKGLVDRGLVHEVWMLCVHEKGGAPFESVEVKQRYDERFAKIPGASVQAGNGGSPSQPFIGRSLRIVFLNPERGPGCALESLSHSMEGMATSGAIPYYTHYFTEYAGLDLKRRYKLPFDSFYAREPGTEIDYPTPTTLAYRWKGERRTLEGYRAIGGNVHFTPTGRRDYDMENAAAVESTIEGYRLGGGPEGRDRAIPWKNDRFARYREIAPDCMGPWLVYWRQNMPGLDNPAKDDEGRPMRNWWPFLFY
jgi:hypothetical protein